MDLNQRTIASRSFFWAVHGLCALHRKPYSMELAQQQLAGPYTLRSYERAMDLYEFQARTVQLDPLRLEHETFPLICWLRATHPTGELVSQDDMGFMQPSIVLQADGTSVLIASSADDGPKTILLADFTRDFLGYVTQITPKAKDVNDPDSAGAKSSESFGFRWFLPELLKHRTLWHEVILASLVIQLIALATPLFTQAIIDKVVVHRAQSTLLVIAFGMSVFIVFSGALTWLRQYLILHTGNRVDAALGSAVFERLFKLPPLYFQHRPTGVIAARLHGVETIREFIASAGVTLILDLPFLVIFVAIMFYYSAPLTLMVLVILGVIVAMSVFIAPLFRAKLNEQFQLGARNQAFITEYIVGVDTVKSLQMEPQLNSRYSSFLASYLQASFRTKQLANSYNTAANAIEQLMGLLILGIGAYTVMRDPHFTIGMLIAFQMFAGRLSQPMLRLVGLWQQFQQASLSVARLGDLMNVPAEQYSIAPSREHKGAGKVEIEGLAFRYAEQLPLVYENLTMKISSGQTVAIMGPSGCGKSTLAKLLLGFYQPSAGRILLDGIDVRHLSANELRSQFGVVPQETMLFSGSILENLQMASPNASFEQITSACKMAEIHSAIEALPEGYRTEIGERGAGLSGGQKQRIAIARALLKRPRILVFDEATSALDASTAEQFSQTVNALKGKVTMLFITHGLPKGLRVDAVYRLGPHGAHLVPQAVTVGSASRQQGSLA